MERVRGTCVVVGVSGVLLRGPSGAGKSDLALRLIDSGARLVSDDYTLVHRRGAMLSASAPEELRGLLEVRGVGIVRVKPVSEAPLVAAIDLLPADAIERLPETGELPVLGVILPLYALAPREPSAPAKVRLVAGIASGAIMRVA